MTRRIKIWLSGSNGQVGWELQRSLMGLGPIRAPRRTEVDLADAAAITRDLQAFAPDLIINPGAWTAVDAAESQLDAARAVNAAAPAAMAAYAAEHGIPLIHFSTDYVFDGSKDGAYLETDPPAPVSAYGLTKLEGEQAIAASGCHHLILRTSWVYGRRGKNFLLTMLRLGAERDLLRVVADQIGAPTWSRTLAEATAHVVAQSVAAGFAPDWWRARSGVYHLTAQGHTSWHGFTEAILAQGLPHRAVKVEPIGSADYPTPAKRPANSRLCCDKFIDTFCGLPDWDEALGLCLAD